MRVVVMGVSGSGKSTVSEAAAIGLGCAFIEADDFHSAEAIEIMRSGVPLNDDNRWPWLDQVGHAIAAAPDDVIAACSSLRRSYRDRLRGHVPDLYFIHVDVPGDVLQDRLGSRLGHFMSPVLLNSQLQTLEPLEPDERGATIDGVDSIEAVTEAIVRLIE